MANLMTIVLACAALSMPAGDSSAGALSVPPGSAPTLDGIVGEDEWRDAAVLATSGTASLLAKTSGDTLFLGLRGVEQGITTVGLAPEGATRLAIFHASASLGTAEYERDGGRWKRMRSFAWGANAPPGSAAGDAARAAFRDDQGWLGTLATMGRGESEMAIDAKAGGWDPTSGVRHVRCAIAHLGQPTLHLPEGAADDLFGLNLQMGTAPANLACDPAQWLELTWSDAPQARESAVDRAPSDIEPPATATATATATADARPEVPALASFRCIPAGNAWIYCSEQDDADALVADVLAAAREFERDFASAPEPGAVVAAPGALPPGCDAQLRAAGARWVLPWLSLGAQPGGQDSMRAQIGAQLREQLQPLGMSEAEIDAQLEQVMAKLVATPDRGGLGLLGAELGHVWFVAGFWGAAASPSSVNGHYGGPAPDWLDESAAILLESEEVTAQRRSGFAKWLAAHPGRVRPLDELFTMTHPLFEDAALAAAQADARATGSAIVRVQMGPPESDDECPFYEQCRSLADYLLATGGEHVFAAIATGAARGDDMATWLAGEGASLGLPGTPALLQEAWLAWADPRPGADGPHRESGSGR